jgi:Zn-finger nucleic acid-binding protein
LSVLKANCPSCAAPIKFTAGSTIVLVCPFCRSAVARTDRKLEDLGKVAEIMQSESPLKLGLSGEFMEHKFILTGRAQLGHESGGFWDEWYATFSNGWVGWLAEAQGKFYMTFYQPLPQNVAVPAFENLQLGQQVAEIPSKIPLMVVEKGTANSIAADGEIPYKLEPNEKSNYADLTGKNNAFGTIDYSTSPPFVFVGQEVTLDNIGLGHAKSAERAERRVASTAMSCPNCGGALELNVPDKTERVTCPYCNSLLDVNQGNLKFLHALKPSPAPQEFIAPIGAEGSFKQFADGAKFKIIGAVARSVTIEGVKYFWHEYLLYNPRIGFRWLVHSDNHWNFVEPVNPAEVETSDYFGKTNAKYNGKNFKIFQDAPAQIEYVKGEFYWRVEVGDTVRAVDFVAPPLMLSQEIDKNEVNWSLGHYLTNNEIEKAFGVPDLPKPWSVAPNQPYTGGFYVKAGFAMLALLVAIAIFMIPFGGFSNTAYTEEINLQPMQSQTAPQTIFSKPFEIKGNRNVQISASAPTINNSWASLDFDLVDSNNNLIESVPVEVEYYSGTDSDGSWTEGSKSENATVSALPAGQYTLRIEGTWQNWQQPLPVTIKVEQNVVRGVNFILALIVLAIVPILALFRKLAFESKRWSESMFGSS